MFLEELVSCYEREKYEEINTKLESHLNSLYEASELAIITKAFKGVEPTGLISKLSELLKGTNAYLAENRSSSNRARNVAFEILVGARFKLAGYDVDFPPTSDLRIIKDKYEILFECKRPSSLKKLDKNISCARKQLKRSYRGTNKRNRLGIIAIDVSKLINPQFNLLISENEATLGDRLSNITTGFIKSHLEEKYTQIGSKNLGILVRYSGIAINKTENIYTYCQFYSFMSTAVILSLIHI